MRFKFASFNVENLFDRPKVFLMDDFQDGDVKLKKISQLQGLIERSTYTAAGPALFHPKVLLWSAPHSALCLHCVRWAAFREQKPARRSPRPAQLSTRLRLTPVVAGAFGPHECPGPLESAGRSPNLNVRAEDAYPGASSESIACSAIRTERGLGSNVRYPV